MFECRLLGSVEVCVDGRLVDVGPAKQRCVLAVLLVEANRVVSVDQLIDRVWADRPPLRVRSSLHSYLTGLRRALASAPVSFTRRSGTYVLAVDEHVIDLHRFRHLVGQARAEADDERALVLAEQALGLWRGEPFAGLDNPWLATVRAGLELERVAARLDHIDVALRCGQHARLLPALSTMAGENPSDERVTGQLMLALYRAGRQADALAHYQHTRRHLAEELGADPGPELQQLHQRILTSDLGLMASSTSRASAAADIRSRWSMVPRQLPAAPRVFIGRGNHLAALTAALDQQGTVVISALFGAGGIGKTWLALAWAHEHLDWFPDGQLFVDLRGFSPDGKPMAPEVAVRGFLDALGVDPGRVPADPQAQTGLLRSLVARKRMLIVLDNAANAEQVAPLLPGGDSCTVLVTSRQTLTGLITRHGAHHLALDTLSDDEALALLTQRLGATRVAAEPDAVTTLIRSCSGLPLALAIVAAHAHTHPNVLLAEFATALHRPRTRHTHFLPDPTIDLDAVLSWSYRALTPQQQTVFGLLGITPGPDIGLPAAASLTGLSPPEAGTLLRNLQEASLLDMNAQGRYSMHDLIRSYAATTIDRDLWETALRRVVDHYLHTAYAADRLLRPHRSLIDIGPLPPDCEPHPLKNDTAAWAWFDVEHACLLAAVQLTADRGWHQAAWGLAWSLHTFHWRRGHLDENLVALKAGTAAANQLGDAAGQTAAHRLVGHAYHSVARHNDAVQHLQQSLHFAKHTGDVRAEAEANGTLSSIWEKIGDDRRALAHATEALRLFQTLDLPVWVGEALSAVAYYRARLGQYEQARVDCERALTLRRRHHDRAGEAHTLDTLGYIAHHTSQYTHAVDHYERAIVLYRECGDSNNEADTLDRLGLTHHALGEYEQARQAWRQARELYQDQGRDDERIQRQLDALDHPNTDHEPPQDEVDQ